MFQSLDLIFKFSSWAEKEHLWHVVGNEFLEVTKAEPSLSWSFSDVAA